MANPGNRVLDENGNFVPFPEKQQEDKKVPNNEPVPKKEPKIQKNEPLPENEEIKKEEKESLGFWSKNVKKSKK